MSEIFLCNHTTFQTIAMLRDRFVPLIQINKLLQYESISIDIDKLNAKRIDKIFLPSCARVSKGRNTHQILNYRKQKLHIGTNINECIATFYSECITAVSQAINK